MLGRAMDDQQMAILKGLVPVAWADGVFADNERAMLEGLLDAYGASDVEKAALRAYAESRRTIDDIDPQELSGGDRRLLLHHAAILRWADGKASPAEADVLAALAERLRIPPAEARAIVEVADEHARRSLHLV
jgi:uncharacterized membrane protein YebE (DUF533 family)